ncbi:MAG: hypothetical protein NUV51_03535 [Sulfuricaulis sp.]|nr:hypothetical protein [Sulfuricaulis sp.]
MSDDTFGDAVWEAWRSGRNPDLVDRDRLWYDEAQGYEPEECVARELRRITPKPADDEEQSE